MKYVIYRRFANLFREEHYDRVSKLLVYAGIDADTETWVGGRLLVALLFGAIGALMPFSVLRLLNVYAFEFTSLSGGQWLTLLGLSTGFAVVFFAAALFLFYLHVYYLIGDRTKRVEAALPDFLLMVAANLRAGLTPFSAFQASARPEFGPLEREIRIVASKALGTASFTVALQELAARVDSSLLRRTIAFFEEGLKSGGKLAQLLETSAEEIKEMEELKRELVLNTKTYTIFLVFVLVLGLPLLLSISSQFLITFSYIRGELSMSEVQGGLAIISSPQMKDITPEFVGNMAIVVIAGTSLLVSVLIGVISEGKLLYGLKYFIPLALCSGVTYAAFRFIIGGFISQIV